MADVLDRVNSPLATPPLHETIIAPPGGLVQLDWRELWQYRDLFLILAWRDISVRYKQTILGILWAVLQPAVNTILYSVIMNRVAHIDSGNPNVPYPVFVCSGLLFWQYFASALNTVGNSMVQNASIIQKVYFPRLIVPASAAVTGLIDFGVSLVVLAGVMVIYRFPPQLLGVVLLPLLTVITMVSALGIGLFLAAVNIKYRDVRHILPFFVQAMMYVTPVIYPSSKLEDHPILKILVIWLNPVAGVITTVRATLLNDSVFSPLLLLTSAVLSVVYFILGLYYFRKTESYFADIA